MDGAYEAFKKAEEKKKGRRLGEPGWRGSQSGQKGVWDCEGSGRTWVGLNEPDPGPRWFQKQKLERSREVTGAWAA